MADRPPDPRRWTLDRHVPIGLIGALFVQTMFFVWWARGERAEIDTQIQEQRMQQVETTRRVETIEARTERERIGERIAVLEHQSREQTQLLRDIYQRLTPNHRSTQP